MFFFALAFLSASAFAGPSPFGFEIGNRYSAESIPYRIKESKTYNVVEPRNKMAEVALKLRIPH